MAPADDDPARIVNVGSIDGLTVPVGPTCVYCASKAVLHHLTRHAVIPVDGGLATSR
ncbi:SDR family NAD(P)-dependent oxidoreductase [Frankia sp. AgPm24]|uniref:SDR family NAD(P)-dependent oxidoreductase n=1 Tax=Frankia sp. AgPm24 TaxID=631128 RepID=UPI00200C8572|nr:SDR family NAD(P)-dependent oxidoreductase [Frankia sp. AgPm24]MCK9924232.1 SDR family NAD(P)-dependent oxidoreductase [Frankia sp. AgPm24]